MAEQGCLLSSYPDKIGIGGSNPPLSATVKRSNKNRARRPLSLLGAVLGVIWNGRESFRAHTLQLGERREWEMACGKDPRRPRDPDVNTGRTVLRTTLCQWGSKKHPRHSATFAEARREANEVETLYGPQSSGFTVDELAQQLGAETECTD